MVCNDLYSFLRLYRLYYLYTYFSFHRTKTTFLIFQHTSHISHIHFQHTLPNTLSHQLHDHPEIPTHFLNLCRNFQHKTYFSDSLFQHTFYKRRRGAFRTPSHLLSFLPTHPSHLLLYPFANTSQEVFQHTHSINSNLPHEIIRFIKLLLKRPVLGFQYLILPLQTLILVFKV